MVKVYSRNGCSQCRATKRWLTQKGVGFSEINIDEHPEFVEDLRARGLAKLPVVEAGDDVWTGFQPSKLNALAN